MMAKHKTTAAAVAAGLVQTEVTLPATELIASRPAVTHRPLLDVDDLDALPEWHRGREALIAFITELNLPGAGLDWPGAQPAQWRHAGMLISVELAYGMPVIILQDELCRTVMPLADTDLDRLRLAAERLPVDSDSDPVRVEGHESFYPGSRRDRCFVSPGDAVVGLTVEVD
jgi:hypothetical protein